MTAINDARHPEYLERVYAGVLGKVIGVYLGRPFEGWSYARLRERFGQVDYYVHEELGAQLVVSDDDISGTFTFLRALQDYGYDPNLTPKQIGQTWMNYLIEKSTILWWGGMGNSTEHTAFLRLKHGIDAPMSGSIAVNGATVAEQIGAQIFVDGWGLIFPGDPAKAVDFARRAASVSHDGEAIYGAQVIAALVSIAFREQDIDRMLDEAISFIPADCTIRKMIDDLRSWHQIDKDWHATREKLEERYGYQKFQGNCHIVPNHGLIILALLYGKGDFDESMMIVNTGGWDTDCNSGNVGAILGVRNGLAAFESKDWRGPVADRMYLPTSDGGRTINDAVRESVEVANAGRALAGLELLKFKRFHFSLPGSVQGWTPATNQDGAIVVKGKASTPTFLPESLVGQSGGYEVVASPTLYSSNQVICQLKAGDEGASGHLFIDHYGPVKRIDGPTWTLAPGETKDISWTIPNTGGQPIYEIGIELDGGEIALDWMDWSDVPKTDFPGGEGNHWKQAWTKAVDEFSYYGGNYWLVQNEGIGLLSQGVREWRDYRVKARLSPRMSASAGLAVRYQGMKRYYAFVFGKAGEVRMERALDGRTTLATADFDWKAFGAYEVEFEAKGNELKGWIDGKLILSCIDEGLTEGAFGFVVEEGCLSAGAPSIAPVE